MKIAIVAAGFTPDEANGLRRAMPLLRAASPVIGMRSISRKLVVLSSSERMPLPEKAV